MEYAKRPFPKPQKQALCFSFCYISLPTRSSRLNSSTDLGIQIPNLWVLSKYFDFTFDMIRFLFFNVYGTHQANAGSMVIFAATAYSAVCTGKDSLRSFNDIQFVLPSFHCARSSHPVVVSRLLLIPVPVVTNASWSLNSPVVN